MNSQGWGQRPGFARFAHAPILALAAALEILADSLVGQYPEAVDDGTGGTDLLDDPRRIKL